MKRLISTAAAALLFIFFGMALTMETADAVVKVGAKCAKANDLMASANKIYACTKVGSKLIWKAASAAQIAKFKAQDLAKNGLALGSKGPGGGTVFYDAGSAQTWGRYLEVAPANWAGSRDPLIWWCNLPGEMGGPAPATGKAIGDGASNTDLIVKMCTAGAAVTARAYRGGGKSDWFLPSLGELQTLCLYANGQTVKTAPSGCGHGKLGAGYEAWDYWSSSALNGDMASTIAFLTGYIDYQMWSGTSLGGNTLSETGVRPIRAF